MASKNSSEPNRSVKPKSRTAILIMLIAGSALMLAGWYFYAVQNREQAINRHYFRVLADQAEAFNNNLGQVNALTRHRPEEVINLYPNYRTLQLDDEQLSQTHHCGKENNSKQFEIRDGRLYFSVALKPPGQNSEAEQSPPVDDELRCWHLPVVDLMPQPAAGFSQLLLVNYSNDVLASQGRRQALSVIKTDEFAKKIAVQLNQDWIQLVANLGDGGLQGSGNRSSDVTMPGFSHYLDIELNPGKYRLFIYPFDVAPGFALTSTDNTATLYLVGVIPKSELKSKRSKRWNLGMVSLLLTALIFAWVMVRMFLLSEHQPMDTLFYYAAIYTSFLLFCAIGSLLFAFGEARLERAAKAQAALELADKTAENLEHDLGRVFNDLKAMKEFYQVAYTQKDPPDCSDQHLAPLDQRQTQHAITRYAIAACTNNDNATQAQPLYRYFGPAFSWYCRDKNMATNPTLVANQETRCQRTLNASQRADSLLVTVFLMNKNGRQTGPQFYFQESSHSSGYLELAHRDYFKKIARHQGWRTPQFNGFTPDFSSYYIQRLRNVTDGTLGTTIGVPFLRAGEFYVMAADINLPSVSMLLEADPSAQQDMTMMVVDRQSGDVLFHYDDNRALTENLYTEGGDSTAIQHAVQMGRDSIRAERLNPIKGHYQGFPGWFISHATPIDQWSIVVFFPNEGLDNYLSNIYFVNFIHFVAALLAMQSILWLFWVLGSRTLLRNKLNIPPAIERRKLMLFASIIVYSQIAGFWLGHAIELRFGGVQWATWVIPMILLALSLAWGVRACRQACDRFRCRHRALGDDTGETVLERQRRMRGTWVMAAFFAVFALTITFNINRVGERSPAALSWYYKTLAEARINRERAELNALAYIRYPNSVTMAHQNPYQLLGVREPIVVANQKIAEPKFSELKTENVMYFSQITQLTNIQRWLELYLIDTADPQVIPRPETSLWGYFVVLLPATLLLIVLWIYFSRHLLYVRLFGTEDMLFYLNKLMRESQLRNHHRPNPRLRMTETQLAPHGQNLWLQLERVRKAEHSQADPFLQLYSASDFLQAHNVENPDLPEIDMVVRNSGGQLEVWLLHLEQHLSNKPERQKALALIKHFKDLVHSGELGQLTLACNVQLPIALLTASNLYEEKLISPNLIEHSEYCAWANLLKDFGVHLHETTHTLIDKDFVAREVHALPALTFIADELGLNVDSSSSSRTMPSHQKYRWVRLNDRRKNHREWHSIRYIMFKAGAFFRDTWCTCNNAEKLALYYLAGGHRINPRNVGVLESLAARGLIKIYRGRVRIVNQSFAYFVRHAEDMETLKNLIHHGDVGAWQDYKVPVSAALLVLFAAVAFWSGSSFYLIVSSLLGLFALVGNLIGGVGFVRSNMFDG